MRHPEPALRVGRSVSDPAIAASLLLAWGLAACASEPAEFQIQHNQAPEEGSCLLSQENTGEAIEEGVFDLSIGDRSSYLLTPLVHNRSGAPLTVTTIRARAFQETDAGSALLRFACPGGGECEEWELSPCGGRDGTDCPILPPHGTGSFEMPVFSRIVTGYFQGQMDAAVGEGRTPPQYRIKAIVELEGMAGERPVTSEPFSFAVTLCLGCLVEYPAGSDTSSISGPDCCGGGTVIPACYPGQDEPLDCRRCVRTLPEICNFGRTTCG